MDTLTIQDYISVSESPVASFNYEKDANPALYGLIHFQNSSIGATSYAWDFDDGEVSNLFEPSHRYDNYGYYNVILAVRNDIGCTDTATLPVYVDYFKGLYVPNAFSPLSGPEGVRKFLPKGKGIRSYRLEIFDTWGIKLWESTRLENGSPAEGWDGMFNGAVLQQDVYIWKIYAEFEDGSVWPGQSREGLPRRTGTVTLLR
jgi:PKD repeat protein